MVKFKILLMFCLFISFLGSSQDLKYFYKISDKIEASYNRFPEEKIYVQTDRNQYFPSDTLWFKSTLVDSRSLKYSNISKFVNYYLFNSAGKVEKKSRAYFVKGESQGYIILPKIEGSYKLVAFTNWILNMPNSKLFTKNIIIRRFARNALFKVKYNKKSYKKGDNVLIGVKLVDNKNRSLSSVHFKYVAKQGEKIIKQGEGYLKKRNPRQIRISLKNIEEGQPVCVTLESIDPSVKAKSLTHIPGKTGSFDFNLFPEGGYLIQNMPACIAFKAVDQYGNPVKVSGVIENGKGQQILEFKSLINGIGKFNLDKVDDTKLFARVRSKTYGEKVIELPESIRQGYQLNVKNISNNIVTVKVRQNIQEKQPYSITVSQRGQIAYAISGIYNNISVFKLPTNKLKAGVTTITLFDDKKQPRCERIVFVNKHKRLHIKIDNVRSIYQPRDKLGMRITTTDENGNAVSASLTVSVVDSALYSNDRIKPSNIFSYFCLESEVRGRVYNPDFLFSDNQTAKDALDLVLMTQGWRRYNWEKLSKTKLETPKIKYSDLITGKVIKNWSKKPVKYASLVLLTIANNGPLIQTLSTDSLGEFFVLPSFTDFRISKMIFSAQRKSGRGKVRLKMNPIVNDSLVIENKMQYKAPSFEESEASYAFLNKRSSSYGSVKAEKLMIDTNYLLDEISVIEKKKGDSSAAKKNILAAFADYSKSGDELLPSSDFIQVLQQVIPFINIDYEHGRVYRGRQEMTSFEQNKHNPLLFMIDDLAIGLNVNDVNYLTSEDIESVFVLTTQLGIAPMFEGSGIGGTVIIYTKEDYKESISSENLSAPFVFTGTKEFYTPKYDTREKRELAILDSRRTIYWNPILKTNTEGKAFVEFYNGDIKNKKVICIEGISTEGLPGYITYCYNVKY